MIGVRPHTSLGARSKQLFALLPKEGKVRILLFLILHIEQSKDDKEETFFFP